MEISRGRVVTVDTAHNVPSARVEVPASAPCARCAAGKGCGAGLLGQTAASRFVNAAIRPGVDVAAGDEVRIALAPENLLRAAWLTYGVPLAGLLVAAALAYLAGAGDLGGALAALAGAGIGVAISRRRLRRSSCLRRFTPTIVERLPAAS